MKRSEAIDIVQMINNTWPQSTALNEEQSVAFAAGIEDLDAALVTRALSRASRELRWRPSIAELREYVRVEAKAENKWRSEPAVKIPPPEWVYRWDRARRSDDWRPFPEQALAMRDMGYDTPVEPVDDPAAWVQPNEYALTAREEIDLDEIVERTVPAT